MDETTHKTLKERSEEVRANSNFKKISVDSAVIEEEKIAGFLVGMSNPNDAKGLALPNIKF